MMTSTFIKKTIVKLLILGIVIITLNAFLNAGDVIVSNELALSQLENSNELFLFREMYTNAVRPTIIGLEIVIVSYILISMSLNTYKFIKNRNNKENTNEN